MRGLEVKRVATRVRQDRKQSANSAKQRKEVAENRAVTDNRCLFSVPKMFKKILATILVAAILLTLVPSVLAATTFKDVPDDAYYKTAVYWAVANGITCGTSDTTFSPNLICNRAQMLTFLWRHAGSPTNYDTSKLNSVTDIPKNAYYTTAMEWAVANGIITPSNGEVKPKNTVTRQDLCYYIYNAAVAAGYAPAKYTTTITQLDGIYKNISSIPGWAKSAVSWCFDNKVISGKGDDDLALNDKATRAEVIVILYRYNGVKQCGGHNLTFVKTVSPTCTKAGYDEFKCTKCKQKFMANWQKALGHDYSKATLVKEATFETATQYQFVCSRCGVKGETRSLGKPILAYPNPGRGTNPYNVLTWGSNSGNGKKTIELYNDNNGTKVTLTRKWFGSAWCYIADIQIKSGTYSKLKGASSYINGSVATSTVYNKLSAISNAVVMINGDACIYNDWGNLRGGVAYGTTIQAYTSAPGHYWNPSTGVYGALSSLGLGSAPKISDLKSLGITDTYRFYGGAWIKDGKLTSSLVEGSDCDESTYQKVNGRRQGTFMGFKKSGSTIHVYLVVSEGNPFTNIAPSSASTVKSYSTDAASYGLIGREKMLLLATLGCDYAFGLDGGGSTQMAVRHGGKIYQVNGITNFQDGSVRPVWDFIYFGK